MTKSKHVSSNPGSNQGLIVFGLDSIGKPKAARFPAAHSAVAKTAAAALNLQSRDITAELQEFAKGLPVGRIHARGKAFVPLIKKDLFDRLNALIKTEPTSAEPEQPTPSNQVFIILGFDSDHKPRGARYSNVNVGQLVQAAAKTDLTVYEMKSTYLKKLVHRLPSCPDLPDHADNVPIIGQALYSEIISEICVDPKATLRSKAQDPLPNPNGLPNDWDTIKPGDLIIAQESHDYGWAEAIVTDRKGTVLTLRYRDYPTLPKFYRDFRQVALLNQEVD